MLEIRPNCECCDKDLPADAPDAMICTYECTFCKTCVEEILQNVCPNCGGGFCPRPIRPKEARRPGLSVRHQMPSQKKVNTTYTIEQLRDFAESIKHLKPEER
ncbi:MAG: DUF1272 domain-containing protein [Gammaproteobacteria bacterium]|nr:DUF1272 domain-containing protein [Gammaproteobacteria bacterium]